MLTQASALRLVDAQAAARDRVADLTTARTARLLREFRGWWTPAEVDALARQVALVVDAGQTQTARLTDAYLTRALAQMLDRPVPPVGVRIEPERWRAAPRAEVYARPAAEVRRLVADGMDVPDAVKRAVTRLGAMVLTDLALAMTWPARQVLDRAGVDGFRRIIRPEVSRGGSCGLCIAAADRTYSRGNLLPIHDRCRCEVLPIIGGIDPGLSLNGDELAAPYGQAGSTGASDLSRVRVQVREHGEVGPVLTNAEQNFRGPAAVAAA